MAQSSQALRTRIKSVKSTRKITKAMEMIANAKLFRQRNKMEANREYAEKLQDTVTEIVAYNPDAQSLYILHNEDVDNKMAIVFCSDLGLCGGYNQNILKMVREELTKENPIYLVGTSLYRILKEEGFNLMNEEAVSSDKITFQELKDVVQIGAEKYQRREISTLELFYTKFVNTMTFRPDVDVLLPCDLNKDEIEIKREGELVETLFEPDASTILNELIPMMIADVTYSDWMESTTAEQGSRRVAMKTATDNADELSEELLLEYNKVRQAGITQEITEIVGGSAAV